MLKSVSGNPPTSYEVTC